jgi:hypothetical protein
LRPFRARNIRHAYSRREAIEQVRSEAKASADSNEDYHRVSFEGEIDVLASWGALKPDAAAKAKRWAESPSPDDVKDERRYLVDEYFESAYLAPLRETKKYLGIKP